MGWSAQYFTTIIIEGNTPNVGIFLYSPTPGIGNLIGSWAAAAGTDQFGNSYPAGINVLSGTLSGVLLQNAQSIGEIIQNAIIQTPQISNPSISGGKAVETTITFDASGGSLLAYSSSTTVVDQTVAGDYTITFPAGVTSAKVECWGADAGGGGGSSTRGGEGGGGGGYGAEPLYSVIAGNVYQYTVGAGGLGGVTGQAGTDGGASFFDGAGVIGGNGFAGSGFVGGQGGFISGNTISFAGGNGGGDGTQSTGGCGGGGRAGSTGAGGNGSQSTSATGAAGGAAGTGTGGHTGGAGGNAAANGVAPGGGAGTGSAVTNLLGIYHGTDGRSYFGSDAASGAPPNGTRIVNGSLYQGGETASGGSFNGTQKSLVRWPASQIQSDWAGATITGVKLRLTNLHSWYNSGLSVKLGYTNINTLPSSFNGSGITNLGTFSMGENSTKTFSLPVSYGNALKNGTAFGFAIGPGPAFNLNYYGYFYGVGGSNNSNPQLTITGFIGAGNTTAGNGQDGEVKITYTSGNQLIASLSPVALTDVFSNAVPAGLGQLQPSGQYSKVAGASTDGSVITVTATGNNLCTTQWSLPANDAKLGTIYRLTCWGDGTQATGASVNLNSNLFLNGTGGTNLDNTNFSSAIIGAGLTFHFFYQTHVIINNAGAGGTCVIAGHATMSQAVATTPSNAGTAAMSDTSKAFNTTVANTLALALGWASTTGAPTITIRGSMLERLGA